MDLKPQSEKSIEKGETVDRLHFSSGCRKCVHLKNFSSCI